MRQFTHVLINTALANLTTSFLWFALTFWVYLRTQSVLATSIIGGSYMLLLAVFGIPFGTLVDHHRKITVMRWASLITLGTFTIAGVLFLVTPRDHILDLGRPWFWLFSGFTLAGAVVESMRNIALSTTVTILVPKEQHANANGLVGAVTGLAFIVTSVFSGLAVGLLGMGWTLVIALVLTAGVLVHLGFLRIPEPEIVADPERRKVDLAGSWAAVRAVPGLFALIIFSTYNNLIGGAYMSLMDPYGLTLFDVKVWGVVFGVCATGFLVGGGLIGRFGLGRNPMKSLLHVAVAIGVLGALFTVREWWWLYAVGIWIYMALVPVIEAAEQTVIQRAVPLERQGRVFGFAQTIEVAAAPITAFIIGPLAEFWIIPWSRSTDGRDALAPLFGHGDARGIALIFFVAGILMVIAALGGFGSRAYRQLSTQFADDEARSDPDSEPALTS